MNPSLFREQNQETRLRWTQITIPLSKYKSPEFPEKQKTEQIEFQEI